MNRGPATDAEIAQLRELIGQGRTSAQVSAAMGRGKTWVIKFAALHNIAWKSRKGSSRIALRRPMPADFPELGATMSIAQTEQHYGCGGATVFRWREEAGLNGKMRLKTSPRGATVPADVFERFPGATHAEISAALGIGQSTLKKHLSAMGLSKPRGSASIRGGELTAGFARHRASSSAPSLGRMGGGTAQMIVEQVQRDMSEAGQAADFLRRLGPVYRCNALGRADFTGSMWRYGNVILSSADLIARAERKGWRAVEIAA